jgi:hypothetical protein
MLPSSDPLGGLPLAGTIYISTVEFTSKFPDGTTSTQRVEVHQAIMNGTAYFFQC